MIDFSRNYFDLFGLAPAFRVDGALLDQAYRQLQTEVHPDRYAGGSDAASGATGQSGEARSAARSHSSPAAASSPSAKPSARRLGARDRALDSSAAPVCRGRRRRRRRARRPAASPGRKRPEAAVLARAPACSSSELAGTAPPLIWPAGRTSESWIELAARAVAVDAGRVLTRSTPRRPCARTIVVSGSSWMPCS